MPENAILGTTLSTCATQSGTYRQLYGMSKVPDVTFAADKVEVTNLSDTNKRYVPGIIDLGEPEFDFYNNTGTDTAELIANSYATLRAAQIAHTPLWFKLVYPDGTGFQWQAYVTVTRTGGGTNDALAFKAKLLITSNITDLPGIGLLTFSCTAGSVSGATKVASVSPTLTAGNSYVYVVGINVTLPAAGALVSGAVYTLGTDIVASASQSVLLVEVTPGWLAVNAGIAVSVPHA